MTDNKREICNKIIDVSIKAVLPDEAVKRALKDKEFSGRVVLVAVGKAAFSMAKAACEILEDRIERGVVVTKYGHVLGELNGVDCYEAGHPVPDENTYKGTEAILEAVNNLSKEDTVLFLLSGGGSALFEKPKIYPKELQKITSELLGCGADIVEINTIRKRLSEVKGGRFAEFVAPAKVYSIILSDILGDPLDMIASGPTCADLSTTEDALRIVEKYKLSMSDEAMALMKVETPKELNNVTNIVNGSVKELCSVAAKACEAFGYETTILTDQMCCQAREAGSFLGSIAKYYAGSTQKLAFVAGGETVVNLIGNGLGGRNQELALSAAQIIDGLSNIAVFSVGSDGTDGPVDAAGGYVDGNTASKLRDAGKSIYDILQNNDAYNGLKITDGLIITGPTGTNVNDVSVVLIN